jgi:hypothetical protein
MTREEQIEKEAKRVSYNGDEFNSFIQGAEWADESMIEKMYKWLETIDFEMEYMNSSDGYTFFDKEKFINDFRKTMEE